ncbi:MAG: glycine cleavage system protein GcvH [bacterium]|jgi:glycine cleavage system H protein|nr:glycine cleavage system protein GcvH [bacterium]
MELSELKFTETHEWLHPEGDLVRMGISDFAQNELGDIVFVELPQVGDTITKGMTLCTVESVKAVSDVYAPVSGTVKEVNITLEDSPEKVNESPFDDGWMIIIELSDAGELEKFMNEAAYREKIDQAG